MTLQAPPAYQAAKEGAAYFTLSAPGLLRFTGETHVDFLQRQTSNDLGLLSPQQAVPSLLTSAQGRVLEHFSLAQDGDNLLMLTQPGHGPGLAAYFQKRIFFNDQVVVQDQSDAYAQIELHGPLAVQALARLGLEPVAALDSLRAAEWQGHPVHLITQPGYGSPYRYLLMLPQPTAPALLVSLQLSELNASQRELLRIEAGLPGDPEFNHQYTPFELGLDRLVSATKGCYTGQEVLARQVTYDKVVRKLARISSQQPLAPGQRLLAEDKPVGEVTSAANSPTHGPLALAVLRRTHDQPGTRLTTENGEEAVILE
ncbi:MAG: folate-binding protein YgfZ [Anaerolineales bacterium]|nr:folate-binding protein YgfZ [Anaerolineales bacterium]MCW5856323.1 folate-binding protein YgfZ [Anaerolineales bacterium]